MQVLDALGSFASAVIALVVLLELLRSRRGEQDRARQAQAEQVTMAAQALLTESSPGGHRVGGNELTIFNESSQVVHLRHLLLVNDIGWEQARAAGNRLPRKYLEPPERILRAHGEVTISLPVGWHIESGIGGSFAVIEFADARGVVWRRRSDTADLLLSVTEIARPQEWFQWTIQRIRPMQWPLQLWPMRFASWIARRHPERSHLPLSARWVCLTHGYWPPGGEAVHDPWLRPNGAPARWGLDGLEAWSSEDAQPVPNETSPSSPESSAGRVSQ